MNRLQKKDPKLRDGSRHLLELQMQERLRRGRGALGIPEAKTGRNRRIGAHATATAIGQAADNRTKNNNERREETVASCLCR